jgi:hypothetical protein
MMKGVISTAQAGSVAVMVSEGGVEDPDKWALLTASLIMSKRADADEAASAQFRDLRNKVEHTLRQAFQSVNLTSSIETIITVASDATGLIAQHAADTKWAEIFCEKMIRDAIEEIVRRNLYSACNNTLRSE